MAVRGLARMLSTSRATSASSASAGTTRLTRPRWRASSAEMNSPVTSISKACLRGTLRDSATPGVAQNRPRLTPLTAKRARSTATARSQAATSWQPAAVATPWTFAITGTARRWIAVMTRPQRPNRSR